MHEEEEVEVRLTVGELRALRRNEPGALLTSALVKLNAALDDHVARRQELARRRLTAAGLIRW